MASPDDLSQWAEAIQKRLLPVIPPFPEFILRQDGLPVVLSFDGSDFPDDFIKGLSAVYENSVPVFPFTLVENADTRVRTFYNRDSTPFFSIDPDPSYDPFAFLKARWPELYSDKSDPEERAWWESIFDPARIVVSGKLIASTNVAHWLFAQSQISAFSPSFSGGGGMAMMMSGGSCTELVFTATEVSTNSGGWIDMGLCVPNPITNIDLFYTTNLLSYPWALAATNLAVTTNSVVWTWTNTVETNADFAAGDASLDTADGDGDSLTSAREFFLHGTDMEDYDTDHDGLSDGWEVQYGFDPLLDVSADLKAHYEMEETSGTNISDSWIYAADGQLTGAVAPSSVTGAISKAIQFDGSNDGIKVPHVTALDIEPELTLAAWIWPAIHLSTSRQAIVQKNLDYYLNTRDGKIQFAWYLLNTNGSYWAPTNILPTGAWSHVAASVNSSNLAMYLNGVQVLATNIAIVGLTTTNDVGLGYGLGGERYWKGSLDELRIYSRGLASNEIHSLWYAGDDGDSDGLRNVLESTYQTDPADADTDNDTLSDGDEVFRYGTDPTVSNGFANVSGTVSYKGSSTGQVVVLATSSKFAWTSQHVKVLSAPGAYTLTNLLAGTSYWIKAFRDLNSNGVWEGKEPPYFRITNITLTASGATGINVHVEKLRGMRVDFGEYYNGQWAGKTTEQIAGLIVSNSVDWGVNTLYARAMTPNSTYWPNPSTLYLRQENGHGANGILTSVVAKAHAQGIKVIGWIQPVIANSSAWSNNPTWRFKSSNGADYEPSLYLLSPFNTNVLSWLDGVISETLAQGVDGLDFSETFYDKFNTILGNSATYDTDATNLFFQRFPGGTLGDSNWWRLRRDILTSNVYQRLGAHVVAAAREFHVTFNWAAQSSGIAHTEPTIAENTGFSFEDLLNLPVDSRPDVISPEFIWQKEAFLHTNTYPAIFNPEWTITMATQFVAYVAGRVIPSFHPEITAKFVVTNRLPSLAQFESTLRYATTNAGGCDFFLHHLAFTNYYLLNGTNSASYGYAAVSNVFTTTE